MKDTLFIQMGSYLQNRSGTGLSFNKKVGVKNFVQGISGKV